MASISETGHAKNVANFQELISFCKGYAETYNPVNTRLTITELEKLYTTSSEKLEEVATAKAAYSNAVNNRKNAFANLKSLATKTLNSFIVSGADALAIQNAKTINRKLQGSSKKTTVEKEKTIEESTNKTISTSQQSYDQLINHFANLIQVLVQNTIYNPNEEELKTTSLQAKLNQLQENNTKLINAYTQYSNAMIQRNNTLYNPLTGLVQTSKEVKLYVKSIFGTKSPKYKQISGLEFKVIRK